MSRIRWQITWPNKASMNRTSRDYVRKASKSLKRPFITTNKRISPLTRHPQPPNLKAKSCEPRESTLRNILSNKELENKGTSTKISIQDRALQQLEFPVKTLNQRKKRSKKKLNFRSDSGGRTFLSMQLA